MSIAAPYPILRDARASDRAPAVANNGLAVLGVEKPKTGTIHEALTNLLKGLFPRKPWAALADLVGISPRTARHRIEGTRDYSADELAELIRSEHGFEFLRLIMAGHQPHWWRICAPLMDVAEVQRMQIAARRRLNRAVSGAVDADRSIEASIARAEAALAFSDEDFHRPQLDAIRAVARASHRSVATTAKRRP